jgi:hypothetical protein
MQEQLSGLNRSMGGSGIGVQESFNLNHLNPASYGSIVQPVSHIFEVGLYGSSNRLSTFDASESKSNGGVTHLSYWFKFKPWWAATIALSPFSSVSYDIVAQRELGGIPIDYNYHGSGNINALKLGNAFRLGEHLSFGVNVSFLFGSIVKNETLDLPTGTLTLENKIVARKLKLDAGLQYKINLPNRSLVIGIIAAPPLKITGKQSSSLYDGNEIADTLHTSTGESVDYSLPASFGMGLGLHSKRSVIAADLKYTNWSNASFSNEESSFTDTWRASAGYCYKGNPDAMNYFGLISFRAGAYAQNHYLNLEGNNLKAWGFSCGASLPAFDNRSSINLTYGYDQLGTTASGLIKQQSQTFTIDIVIRDLWGIKRKFD